MNFLAHIFLSGDNDEIKLGNFIGDFVKGNAYNNYSPLIRKGILLHRKIDSFTDSHPVVRQHKSLFYDKYHKYAGIIIDILYDHFLAHFWHMFSEVDFDTYVKEANEFLINNADAMPEELKKAVPNLLHNNWLYAYRTIEGIESVLIGMSKGTSLPPEYDYAIKILRKNYENIKHDFFNYFPQLMEYVQNELESE
jgi:acyl carrier protein phosphodiesterase